MAERIVEQLIDDIDGSDISDGSGEEVFFSFRDAYYRIDLSARNVAKLEKLLRPYIDVATKLPTSTPGRRPKLSTIVRNSTYEHSQTIRLWARKNGYNIASRGRIGREIVEAYEVAHGDRKR